MRTILTLCALIALAGGYFTYRATRVPLHYGEFTGAPAVPVSKLVETPKDFLGKAVATEGTVSQQCKSMGCYFFFPSGTKTLRVELKDIAMTAPMREGRAARVEGQIVPYDDGYQLYANAIEFK